MQAEELSPRGLHLFSIIGTFGWDDYSFGDVEYAIHDDEWEWAIDLANSIDKKLG